MKYLELLRNIAAVAAVATMAVTCGLAVRAAPVSGTALAGEVDVRRFDVGSYPVEPLEYRANYAHSLEHGTELAIMRLAGHIVQGYEVDEALAFGTGYAPVAEPREYRRQHAQADFQEVLRRNQLAYGIVSSVSATEGTDMDSKRGEPGFAISVFQFPDAAMASAAAAEFEAIDFGVAADVNTRVQLAGHPSARSHWRPEVRTLGTRLSHGSYMISLTVSTSSPELAALTTLATRVLDKQLPLLDSLPPLSRREIYRLGDDPFDLLRRTLKLDPSRYPQFPRRAAAFEAVVDGRGAILFQVEQAEQGRLFGEVGVDRAAFVDGTILLRARDPAAAHTLQHRLAEGKPDVVAGPDGVPDTICRTFDDRRRYTCNLRYDRYVATVFSDQIADVRQRAAAQYALLANS
ncbi:hypothetical protein [Nocardia sp. NPDC058666]|uniref:DUF7373 family lipoprotein n=1 Tax=unclassified Nocardia TaxID=2637762 RepID=UPI003657420A